MAPSRHAETQIAEQQLAMVGARMTNTWCWRWSWLTAGASRPA